MIAGRIREALQAPAERARATDVRVGLGYTAVLTDSGSAGVAYTPREDLGHGCSPLQAAFPLVGRRVVDLLSWVDSRDPLERAVGLAAANAVIGTRRPASLAGEDIVTALALRPTDRVGMVGCFEPLIAPVQARVTSLTIFERGTGWRPGVQPAERALDLLPTCSVALITSTAIITASLDALLEAATGCRDVVLLGPSTPLLPDAFEGTPVTWLSGIRIGCPQKVLRVVSEGGGTRAFSPYVKKVNLHLPRRDPSSATASGITSPTWREAASAPVHERATGAHQ